MRNMNATVRWVMSGVLGVVLAVTVSANGSVEALWLGGTDHNWSTAANWTNATVPVSGDTVLFYGAPGTYRDIVLSTEETISMLVFTNASQAVTLTGGVLALTNTVGISVEPNSASHVVRSAVKLDNGGGDFLIHSGSTFTVSGPITNVGAVELIKRGDGTLILSGNNPYGLGTNQYGFGVGVMGGTLVVGSNENLGLPYHHVFLNNAATLHITHTTAMARPFWMDGTGTISVDADQEVALSPAYNGVPVLNGGGALTKAGLGRLIVGGSVTAATSAFWGNITVEDGEFQMNETHLNLGDVYIFSNGMFSGIGTVGQFTNSNFVVVHAGSVLKPGTQSAEGALTFTNGVSSALVTVGGTLEIGISATNVFSSVDVAGTLALDPGSLLQVNVITGTDLGAITYTIATADVLTGTFAVTNGVPYGYEVRYTATALELVPVPVAPRITVDPVSLTNTAGEMATFSVTAEGPAPLAYQWQKDLVDLGGKTSYALVITSTTVADSGSYRCIVTNAYGAVTSDVAVLLVNAAPTPTPTATGVPPTSTPTATAIPPTATPSVTATATPCPTATPLGYANLGVYQPLSGNWYVLQASTLEPVVIALGGPGYYPVAADYDGDRHTDIAVYNLANGLWYVLQSGGGGLATAPFGGGGFMPIPMDYDGDAKADPAVYLEANGAWAVMMSGSSYAPVSTLFGGLGYEAVPADYDGDAKADPAVYTAEAGRWTVMLSGAGYLVLSASFGGTGLAAAEADYDGDGKTDPTVYANGYWYSMMSAQGYTMQIRSFGGTEYTPVPGDYDGDRIDDLAVYNAAAGQWYILPSMPGSSSISLTFGGATFMPVGVVR